MKAGIVRVSYEMLEQLMKLPDGMTILRVIEDAESYKIVMIQVTGEQCPEVIDGGAIPWIDWEWTP